MKRILPTWLSAYQSLRQSLLKVSEDEREARNMALTVMKELLQIEAASDLFMQLDRELTAEQATGLQHMEEALLQNRPLQYVLGYTDFDGLRLKVDERVLIPRPETESLVHEALRRHPQPQTILDIGTGSGCLALSLKRQHPKARVVAWDRSREALALAEENARNLKLTIEGQERDFWEESKHHEASERYALIVSNPPYVTKDEWHELSERVRAYEPRMALVPEEKPVEAVYEALAELALHRLEAGGWIGVEIHADYGAVVQRHFARRLHSVALIADYTGRDRFIFGRKPK